MNMCNNTIKTVYKLALITMVALFIISCKSDKTSWLKAKGVNTIGAYNKHIKEFPKSIFMDSAKMEIDWLEASQSNTFALYEKFGNKYPNSDHLSALDVKMAWVDRIIKLDCSTGEFEYLYRKYFDWKTTTNESTAVATFSFQSTRFIITDKTDILLNDQKIACDKLNDARAIKVIIIDGKLNTLQVRM